MDITTLISYQRGTLPSCYWYQLNGKPATENYNEQRFAVQEDDEEIIVTSEVVVK